MYSRIWGGSRPALWFCMMLAFALAATASTAHATPNDPAAFSSLGNLTPGSNVTVNTNGPTMTGGASFTGVVSGTLAVFCFDNVNVPAGVTFTVSGTRPLVILSKGNLIFNGTLNANASGSTAGAGGFNGNTVGVAGSGNGAGQGDSNGGAGAGFGGGGGDSAGGTLGGLAHGDLEVLLHGGSGGGKSTFNGGLDQNGGGGGGAVELGATGTVTIGGTISCVGANGASDPLFSSDGGGGGSGGAIIVHSTTNAVTLAVGSILTVDAGSGGDGEYGGGGGGGGRILCQGTALNLNGQRFGGGGVGGTGSLADGFDGTGGLATDNIIAPPGNTPPVVSGVSVTVPEDGSYTFTANDFTNAYTDADNDPLVTVRVVNLPANGTLQNNGVPITAGNLPVDIPIANIGNLSYIPNADFDGTDNFNWNASDGTDFATVAAAVTITVTPANDAPVLDNSGNPALNSAFDGILPTQGTTVAALLSRAANGDPISDVDSGAQDGIAITNLNSLNGTWEFTIDGGNTWTAVPVPLSDSNALLLENSASAQLRLDTTGFAGLIDPAITFRAWDRTQGTNGSTFDITGNGGPGGSSAFSTGTETASILVVTPGEIDVRRGGNSIASGTTDTLAGNVAPQNPFTVNYTIHNTGNGTINLTGNPRVEITGTVNASALVTLTPDASIASGGNTGFSLAITPAAVGGFTVTLEIANDDPNEPTYTITISGTAADLPDIAVEYQAIVLANNSQLQLGTLTTATPKILTFTVRNAGTGVLGNLLSSIEGALNCIGNVVTQTPTTIAGNSAETLQVSVRPLIDGNFSMRLRIASDDPDENPTIILISGTGTTGTGQEIWIERLPGLEIGQTVNADDLGNVLTTANAVVDWTIRNVGSADLAVTGAAISNATNCAAVITAAPAGIVVGGDSTPVTVMISPATDGPFSFDLTITSDDADEPTRVISINGIATPTIAPEIQIYGVPNGAVANNGTIALPPYPTGGIAGNYPFVIENRGTSPLTIVLPIQLGLRSNAAVTIAAQPGSGGTLVIPAHGGFAVVVVQMTPSNPAAPASFFLYVTSDDADENLSTIIAESPGPEGAAAGGGGNNTNVGNKGGCGIGAGIDGAWMLGLLAALVAALAAGRRRPRLAA